MVNILSEPKIRDDLIKGIFRLKDETKDQRIQLLLVDTLYLQNKVAIIGELIAATIFFAVLWNVINQQLLASWYICFLFICVLARAVLFYNYKRTQISYHNVFIWQLLFTLGAGLTGLFWGIAGSILMPHDILHQTFVIFLLIGLTAASNAFYISVRSTYVAFLLPLMMFLSVWFFLQGEIYVLFGIMSLIYMIFMLISSYYTNHVLVNALSLKFENKELKETNKQLEIMVTQDPLTRVANFNYFQQSLDEALTRARHYGKMVCLFFLNLDNYKKVNSDLGRDVGDKLLIEVAIRLKLFLNEVDTLAHIGGDEFTIVIGEVTDIKKIERIAYRMGEVLSESFTIDDHQLNLTTSIGISCFPLDGEDVPTLIRKADTAMYRAQKLGGNCYQFYNPKFRE